MLGIKGNANGNFGCSLKSFVRKYLGNEGVWLFHLKTQCLKIPEKIPEKVSVIIASEVQRSHLSSQKSIENAKADTFCRDFLKI